MDDRCSYQAGATRDDEDAAVDVVGCCALKVVPLEVDAGDIVEEVVEEGEVVVSDYTLAGANETDYGVFERREGAAEKGVWPEDVVIGVYGNFSSHIFNSLEQLSTLVCFIHRYDFDSRVDFLAGANSLQPFIMSDD